MEYGRIAEVSGYRLAECIGSGGMGEVYKAYNSSLNRFAAVKILYQSSFTDRFENEAYIQSSVNHPNIARLYEYTACGDKHCILMEYVEGETLDCLLQRKGKLTNEETENIIGQIVSALAYLHKKDIMHRDIKPQNFKIEADGTVKMLDFGIAKSKYTPRFTQVGFIVGTTEYLAPEQFQQAPELKSDVWALAVMTYQLRTGFMPFENSNPVTLQTNIRKANYTDPKILVPDISEKLSMIIAKSLRVNPVNRISSSEIEALLGKKKQNMAIKRNPILNAYSSSKKPALSVIISVAALFFIIFLMKNRLEVKPTDVHQNNIVPTTEIVKDEKKINGSDAKNKIIINTPGIKDAEIILPDGGHRALPDTVSGKEGDKFEFTIRANGYLDKEVEVVLTPRRISYEFNLEKKQ